MGFHRGRDRRQQRPKTAAQLQKEIDAIEFRLETEALKFSEEKKLRSLITDLKKQKKLAAKKFISSGPKSSSRTGTIKVDKNTVEEVLVHDFAEKLRVARRAKGMTQEEFALSLNEKESVYSKWENGSLTPSISVAKQLEKKLRVTLVVEAGVETADPGDILKSLTVSKNNKTATLGDMVKLKVRNR